MGDFADVRKVTERALQMTREYYRRLDTSPETRATLMEIFAPAFPPDGPGGGAQPTAPILEWNGYRLYSPDEVADYISSLPKTKHEIKCADAQPLPGCNEADNFFVSVHGHCTYDDEHVRRFFQRFVVHRRDGKYYIVNDYFRWTGEV
jgi:hypothetical protein